jgi:hypothetical protein
MVVVSYYNFSLSNILLHFPDFSIYSIGNFSLEEHIFIEYISLLPYPKRYIDGDFTPVE